MRPTICYCKEPCDDYFANEEAQCAQGRVDSLKRDKEHQYRLGQGVEFKRWTAAFAAAFGHEALPGLSPEENITLAIAAATRPVRDELREMIRQHVQDCCGHTGCGAAVPCRAAVRETELALQAGWPLESYLSVRASLTPPPAAKEATS